MAKKTRRVRRKGTQPRLSEAQLVQPTENAIKEAPLVAEVAAPEVKQLPAATDFQKEYHYVVKDLQRIGLLAAAMLGGLLILSFIL
jgi:hypothetical protein